MLKQGAIRGITNLRTLTTEKFLAAEQKQRREGFGNYVGFSVD
jgi:hypothetical protein